MAAAAGKWERRLEREGLGDLDYSDGCGGIMVSNRGSGKVLDEQRAIARQSAAEELKQRLAVLAQHRFRRGERRAYALYAGGLSVRQVALRLRKPKSTIGDALARAEREYANAPGPTLLELLGECEPTTIALMFALIERALEAPDEVRELMGQARGVPELRAMIQPDEVDDGA